MGVASKRVPSLPVLGHSKARSRPTGFSALLTGERQRFTKFLASFLRGRASGFQGLVGSKLDIVLPPERILAEEEEVAHYREVGEDGDVHDGAVDTDRM